MSSSASPSSSDARLQHLFDPRGVIVVGASSHPAKFGFTALHNVLAAGYAGKVFATNLDGGSVLGVDTLASIDGQAHVKRNVNVTAQQTSTESNIKAAVAV